MFDIDTMMNGQTWSHTVPAMPHDNVTADLDGFTVQQAGGVSDETYALLQRQLQAAKDAAKLLLQELYPAHTDSDEHHVSVAIAGHAPEFHPTQPGMSDLLISVTVRCACLEAQNTRQAQERWRQLQARRAGVTNVAE